MFWAKLLWRRLPPYGLQEIVVRATVSKLDETSTLNLTNVRTNIRTRIVGG